MLADMLLSVMAASRAVQDMFEEQSFLRDPNLLLYITQILESLNEYDIVLENSITQGICWVMHYCDFLYSTLLYHICLFFIVFLLRHLRDTQLISNVDFQPLVFKLVVHKAMYTFINSLLTYSK